MPNKIIQLNNGNNSVSEFVSSVRQGLPSAVFGAGESFKTYLASEISGELERPVLYVVKDMLAAGKCAEYLSCYQGKKTIIIPPKDETLILNRACSKDSLFQRIKAAGEIKEADFIVATPESLMQRFPLTVEKIELKKDRSYERSEITDFLVRNGYKRTENVEGKGCFTVRGDVIDVFSPDAEYPVRLDFFDDDLESIKSFDPETRANLGYTDSVTLLSACEFCFSDEESAVLLRVLKEEIAVADKKAKERLREIFSDVELAVENKDYDFLSALSSVKDDSVFIDKILRPDTVIIIDEPKRVYEAAELYEREFDERFKSLSACGEVFSIEKDNVCGTAILGEIFNKYTLAAVQTLSSAIPFFAPKKIINPKVASVSDYRLDIKELFSDVRNWLYGRYYVTVCAGTPEKAERLKNDFAVNGIFAATGDESATVNIIYKNLPGGFIFHESKNVVIGSGNIFGKSVAERKIKTKKNKFFTAPVAGDYCVHEIHGIGRVLGNKKITTLEGTKDYIAVEYKGGDILYVPVEQTDILTRYIGGDKKPALSKIGGKDFERIKNNVKESIKKMSFDLKRLYEERNACTGYKFACDGELFDLFVSAFEFEDTPDQAAATKDVIFDMESGKIMDRLICGDVGFGKTEVAFRAVFIAIVNGKQAVMLAPTTILAEQHYNTAIKRFKDFGIKIACLNRFRTDKEQKAILEQLKNGELDFVIGTHRILSGDVKFKDLGLLVLDEEQRFGVEHKEKIKLLKKNVDTLTLTATPIPRTLHMSLSGIRSISTINTPPKKRLPVQTYVTEETDVLIKDACTRELNRGGQVFILYNRVESIYTFAERIIPLLPNVPVAVAHGQMEEKQLESNILNFYEGKTRVLVSTTIIENGIDLPKANTLIVIDADKLGLSTLYQLKGRVGRSDRLAYAYFTYKREKILTETAYNRLNAIVEFAEMGSGIKIAMRDLEIRGAGNVLGAEQHGHMDKIGYELYSKLLKEEIEGKEETIAELDVRVTAYIPDGYIESRSARMDAYKDIAEIAGEADEEEVRFSLADAYGPIPEETDNLIIIAVVKNLAKEYDVTKITVSKERSFIEFKNFKTFGDERLKAALDAFKNQTRVVMRESPIVEFANVNGGKEALKLIRKFLDYKN